MLKGNLSSRPFYNERLVSLLLVVVAVFVAGLTVFNASRLMALSSARTELDGRIALDRDEASRIRNEAQAISGSVDPQTIGRLAYQTAEANGLIADRSFSWSEFFGIFEGLMPYDVRLVGVAHRFAEGERLLILNVVARSDSDLNDMRKAMLETGVFYDVLPKDKLRNDDDSMSAIVEAYYLPGSQPRLQPDAANGTGGSR